MCNVKPASFITTAIVNLSTRLRIYRNLAAKVNVARGEVPLVPQVYIEMQAERCLSTMEQVLAAVERYWGFNELRPMQARAIQSSLDGRDSLVVLPTGGGKSLCYQAPAVVRDDLTVVVSPLIALMKDQVDGLKACGIAAAKLDSSQSPSEKVEVERALAAGEIKLLFVSPERLANYDFCRTLQKIGVTNFAIDEAHCISHWGHDFRPEYRQMQRLKTLFPGAVVHAFTATATTAVREDIIRQLNLTDPDVFVGNFDRPNLTYRVLSRRTVLSQVMEVLDRHKKEAGIIYCIRRKEVDELQKLLVKNGVKAVAYHAGLTVQQRHKAQEAFSTERCDLIVATVAFGMGIDRSNVRFVMHTGMPKSLEHYQQETGRAGRDGLEAECVLLYSVGDVLLWQSIMEKASNEAGSDPAHLQAAKQHLEEMSRYARGAICRHQALVEYFGQEFEAENCAACDICLGDTVSVSEPNLLAQKIISCIARVKGTFGIGHIVSILRGENLAAVRKWQHEKLSTFGLLKEFDKVSLRDWVDQLIGQGVINQINIETAGGSFVRVIGLNNESLKVLRGELSVRLMEPMQRAKEEQKKRPKPVDESWDGVDKDLFDSLRTLRRELADERKWQPYMVFNDTTLREMARVKPLTLDEMLHIHGVGATKLQNFGAQFLAVINDR